MPLIFRINTASQALMQWGVWAYSRNKSLTPWEVRALPPGVPLLGTGRPGNSSAAKSVFPTGPLELAIHAELIKSPSSILSQFHAHLWSRVGKQKETNKSKFKKLHCFKQVDLTFSAKKAQSYLHWHISKELMPTPEFIYLAFQKFS